jgi:predicted branched-subunit amino acid permease
MTSQTQRQFREGMAGSIPVLVAAAPFGMLFGALAIDNGMGLFEAVLMSAMVYAGASQMVGIELFGAKIAPWMIVLSIFAVNFRHVLYSASLSRLVSGWTGLQQVLAFFLLTDPQYAEAAKRSDNGQAVSFAWYLGFAAPIYVLWVIEAWLGASFGKLIRDPHALGLDFLLPIYFLGLTMSFRRRPGWLPIVVISGGASIVAYLTVGSPWHVSLGALAGIVYAVIVAPSDSVPPVSETPT